MVNMSVTDIPDKELVEAVEFNALRNAIYHTARRTVLDTYVRWSNLIIIVAGAGTLTQLADTHGFGWILGLITVLAGAMQLVFDFSGRAAEHKLLQHRYYTVLADVRDDELSPEHVRRLEAEMLRIAGDEPPVYRALDAISYNAAADSLYGEERADQKLKISWTQSALRHLYHFNGSSFDRVTS